MMNGARSFLSFLSIILCVAVASGQQCGVDPSTVNNPIRLPSRVTLDRVRACSSSGVFCNSRLTRPDYGSLDSAMSKKRAKKLFLSQVNNPRNARNAVIFFAGQRFAEGSDGASGGLTGQQSPYRFDGSTSSRTVNLRSDSYAKRLLDMGYFSADDTFVGLVFDARFHYEYSRSTKNDIVRGYVNYVVGKLGNRAETIVLAGHSRGGCLVLRVAQQLIARYPRARVIVQGFDPVCAAGNVPLMASEFGAHGNPKTRNPYHQDSQTWEIFNTNMNQQYLSNRRYCLGIRNFVSGDPVPGTIASVHGIGHGGFHMSYGEGSLTSGGRTWYEQSWTTSSHVGVVFSRAVWRDGLAHFQQAMEGMPCSCGSAPVPTPPTPSPPQPTFNDCIHQRRDRQLRMVPIDDCPKV